MRTADVPQSWVFAYESAPPSNTTYVRIVVSRTGAKRLKVSNLDFQ